METKEVEMKLVLVHEEPVPALSGVLGPPVQVVDQLNRYFFPGKGDTPVIRFREQSGGVVLTQKWKGSVDSNAVFVRREKEQVVPPEWLVELTIRGSCPALEESGLLEGIPMPLRFVGQMFNTRHFFSMKPFEVCLDRTVYPDGRVIFEVEVESPEVHLARDSLIRVLDRAGIGWVDGTRSKFDRLHEWVRAGRNQT